MAKLVRLSTIVSRIPSIWELVDLPFHLIDRLEQLFQALGGQILRPTGIMTLLAAANALTVSIPREG